MTTYPRPAALSNAVLAVCLAAPNDRNGNPRRLSLYLDHNGEPIGHEAHGYHGPTRWAPRIHEGPRINVSATEYKTWLTECSPIPHGWEIKLDTLLGGKMTMCANPNPPEGPSMPAAALLFRLVALGIALGIVCTLLVYAIGPALGFVVTALVGSMVLGCLP